MIEKTLNHLIKTFKESLVYQDDEAARNYRIEHSIRTASLAKKIALLEGYNVENVVIACLLHDISYAYGIPEGRHQDHGRLSARIAREFLRTLPLDEKRIESICGAIAIHVDDEADFDFERTEETEVAGEADNLDRFDAYRIYEILEMNSYSSMTLKQKKEYVDSVLQRLNRYLNIEMHSKTASQLWQERISFQIQFFTRLKQQIEMSEWK